MQEINLNYQHRNPKDINRSLGFFASALLNAGENQS
jgi:hypothetical protein